MQPIGQLFDHANRGAGRGDVEKRRALQLRGAHAVVERHDGMGGKREKAAYPPTP